MKTSTDTKGSNVNKFTVPKISNFRMAKRCTVNLEFNPNDIDYYANYFLLSYQNSVPFVDIYEKNGTFFDRIDIGKDLEEHGNLKLQSI